MPEFLTQQGSYWRVKQSVFPIDQCRPEKCLVISGGDGQ
jgi:hypothetical protein